MIDEIWMMRKKYLEKMPELKKKHRHVYLFRSALLQFLEKQFQRAWVQHFTMSAELGRVKVWPMDEN